jgi:hypothetical protein
VLSSAAPGSVPEAATMRMATVPQSLLFDNDEPTICREAMMGPDSVKWVEALKSVIVSYTRN